MQYKHGEATVDAWVKAYLAGDSVCRISALYGAGKSTVRGALLRRGIAIRHKPPKGTRAPQYEGVPDDKLEKAYSLYHNYKISLGQYELLLSAQNGCCAICKQPPSGGGRGMMVLHVDHDHVTGEVRALLCVDCNTGLGKFQESPDLLESAAAYLRTHAAERQREAA